MNMPHGPINIISAFTEEQVARLTGVSKRQLGLWDRDGFFVPALAYADRTQSFSRLYSFRDLVSLKVLNQLRNETKVPLSHLREVKEKLAHLGDDLWAKTTLFILGKRVVFENPETGAKEDVVSGQGVLQIPLRVVTGDMHERVKKLNERDATQIGHFDRKRNVAYNQVVVAGTRIPVRGIRAFADAGYTVEQIRNEYPTLTEEDIRAAMKLDAAA
jgi:uncharacterized protein (DUF433 family)